MARNLDTATERYRKALELGRESGLSRWVAGSHRGLGAVARRREAHDRAGGQFDEALSGHEGSGVGASRSNRGSWRSPKGNSTAPSTVPVSRVTSSTIEADHWLGRCQQLLGAVAVDRGDTAAGRRH